MKLSRRDFIHAGCTVGIATMLADPSEAVSQEGSVASSGFSQRNVLNMGFQSVSTYAFINHYIQGGGNTSPLGTSWSATTETWNRALGANGWPSITEPGQPPFGGSWTFPGADEFNGPYVFQWDGDGFIFENSGMTWSETNLVKPGRVTITRGNQNIAWSNNFSAGQAIVLDNRVGNVSAFTTYYVSSAGLTTSNIRLADTRAHAIAGTNAITPSASGTATLFGPYQKGGNGRWFNTNGASGADAQIIAIPSGVNGSRNTAPIEVFQTNQYGNELFIHNLQIFRLEDASDLASGLLFRKKFKQSLVNLNPSAIRFMNWFDGGAPGIMRFENRRQPGSAGNNGATDWLQSPAYADISGVNQWTLAAATPTTGNRKMTPVSMLNGEIVTCRIKNANFAVRTGQIRVSTITNANPGQVTTSTPHGFSTGDKIIHVLSGMPRLSYFPVTITVTGVTTYTIGVDTTSFGAFVSGVCCEFLTLNVGGRGAFPITQGDGVQPQGYNTIQPSGNYGTFLFDKSSSSQTDGTAASFRGSISGTTLTVSGATGVIAVGQTLGATNGVVVANTRIVSQIDATHWTVNNSQTTGSLSMTSVGWIYGVWLYNEQACGSYIPIEYCVALVNEVNALAASQGIANLTHCWLNTPVCALTATDPDYTTASDWGLGLADVATNPNSTLRATGYSALGYSGATKINNAQLFVELANELWNPNFVGAYQARRQALRWPNSSSGASLASIDWHAFQSSLIMKTIKAANFGGNPIKCVLGGWAIASTTPLGFGSGYELINGSNTLKGTIGNSPGYSYTTDAYVVANSFGIPMNNHDVFAIAPYFDPPDAYFSRSTGFGTFTDDSAMYNGLNNSGNGAGNYSGAANQSQAITNFTNQMLRTPPLAGAQATTFYVDATGAGQMTNYANLCKAVGKVAINYEGGADWNVTAGQGQAGRTFTSGDALFVTAVINSAQWAIAQVGYFNRVAAVPGAAMPSVYTFIGFGSQRWSYCNPDSFVGTVEGQALTNNPTWAAMGARNQALTL